MFRLSAPALLATAVAFAAPVPKEGKKDELYFSTTVGTKWVMSMTGRGGNARESAETVTKVEMKDGVYTVTVEHDGSNRPGGTTISAVYEVSAKGVFLASTAGQVNDKPVPQLKLGAKAGDTWEAEVKRPGFAGGAGDTAKQTYTLGQEEVVEVPAGKFKAVRVTVETSGQTAKSTAWYAPGVGLVRTEVDLGGRKMVRELKSFTPGKGEKMDEPKKDK